MDSGKSVGLTTLILTAVAGFCDTATFVAGGAIFSAHVTGNFVVFAAQVARGQDASAYVKLITFPVFIIAVIAGGWLIRKTYPILMIQGVLLTLTGILAWQTQLPVLTDIIVMLTVFAMGLQNAFGKMFAKATHGPTTMMTGNVTQAALDLGSLIFNRDTDLTPTYQSLKRISITIGGFLTGCIGGAVLGRYSGLGCLLLPGVAMLLCYFVAQKHSKD